MGVYQIAESDGLRFSAPDPSTLEGELPNINGSPDYSDKAAHMSVVFALTCCIVKTPSVSTV